MEILEGETSAHLWLAAYGDEITRAAYSSGASEAVSKRLRWGALLEFAFATEAAFEEFLKLPVVRAALDAVPRPVNGVIYHRGWGGTGGDGEVRRPRPFTGSGAAEVPVPLKRELVDAVSRL